MEDRPVENIQNEPLRDKMMENTEDGVRDLWDTVIRSNVHIYSLRRKRMGLLFLVITHESQN